MLKKCKMYKYVSVHNCRVMYKFKHISLRKTLLLRKDNAMTRKNNSFTSKYDVNRRYNSFIWGGVGVW